VSTPNFLSIMLTLPSLDLHFRLPSSSSVDQHHCTRMMTFTPLGRSLCPATTSHLKRFYAFKATSHLTANIMPHGNVAPQATFMPSKQLRTLQRILCLTATSYLKRSLCPRGNFALQATFMPLRQLGTSNDLSAFEATSHLITNLILHGNVSLYRDLHAS